MATNVLRVYVRHRQMNHRVEDVKLLSGIFINLARSNSSVRMEDLLREIQRRHLHLWNPIAINPELPSYRIVPKEQNNDDYAALPGAVVIEETNNTRDTKLRVRGYADGAVCAARR